MKGEEMKPMEGQDVESETSPLDAVISRVDSYIKNPKMVTPETLMELKSELEAIKSDVDGMDEYEDEEEDMGKKPGLMIMIGKAGKRGMK